MVLNVSPTQVSKLTFVIELKIYIECIIGFASQSILI